MGMCEEVLEELKSFAEENYKNFMQKLLKDDTINVLGVRIPTMRKIAKKYSGRVDELINFPDDYFEVTFVKLCAVANLPYERFLSLLDECVKRIDNWASCDCFKAKCVENNKQDFVKYIDKYLDEDKQFYQRFALVSLLNFYVEEPYLAKIYESVNRADTNFYYVSMAVAWLIAEVLVKYFDNGVEFLKCNTLDVKTHNRCIQKAKESYRLSDKQKMLLNNLKR
jgi:3-methyladenine DNA glycosylase AlkD